MARMIAFLTPSSASISRASCNGSIELRSPIFIKDRAADLRVSPTESQSKNLAYCSPDNYVGMM